VGYWPEGIGLTPRLLWQAITCIRTVYGFEEWPMQVSYGCISMHTCQQSGKVQAHTLYVLLSNNCEFLTTEVRSLPATKFCLHNLTWLLKHR